MNVVLSGMKRTYEELEAGENEMLKQAGYFSLSKMCIHAWMSDMKNKTKLTITLNKYQVGIPPPKLKEYIHDYIGTIMACNEHLNEVGLEISSLKINAHGYLEVKIKTMREIRKVLVSGAGCEAVNGVYIASAEGRFARKGEWEGEERTFELFCGKYPNGDFARVLGVLGEEDDKPQVQFYRARCATSDG